MSEFLELTEELKTAVDQLNQVLQGDENATVMINGEEKPSVQKKTLDEVLARVQLVLDAAADIDAVKYANTAAGIAATTDGQFFSVVSSNDDSYLDLYENVSGVAELRKTYPNLEYVLYTTRALSKKYGNPNLLSADLVMDGDDSWYQKSATVVSNIDFVNGLKTLRISGGFIWALFTASSFRNTNKISVSMWVEKVIDANPLSRFRVLQKDINDSLLSTETVPFGLTDYTASKFFYAHGLDLNPSAETIEVQIQSAETNGAGAVYIRDICICEGNSAHFREMSNKDIFDSIASSRNYVKEYELGDKVKERGFISESDITLSNSANLAVASSILYDTYVNNTGTLTTGTGWVTYKIPVVENTEYSIGNFSIDIAGYSSFIDANGNTLKANGSYTTASLPKTYQSPSVPSFLYITVARPTNDIEDWNEVMVNEGEPLLPYTPPESVTKIGGYPVAGADEEQYAKNGADAYFRNLEAHRITASMLHANLPRGTSLPADVEVNQAWLDTSNGTIRVRLS